MAEVKIETKKRRLEYSIPRLRDGISDAQRNIVEMKRVIKIEMDKIAEYKGLIRQVERQNEEDELEAREAND